MGGKGERKDEGEEGESMGEEGEGREVDVITISGML